MVMRFNDIDVIASTAIPSHRLVMDTSGCRSPARAKRRFNKRGIAGRIKFRNEPDYTVWMTGNKAYVNALTYDALKKMIDELPPAPRDPLSDMMRFTPKMPEPEPAFDRGWLQAQHYGLSLIKDRTIKTVIDC